MAISVKKIQDYMKNDANILISGEAGTGKTQMVTEASKKLKLNMKYYSAATLDPYADLVGIPVPQNDSKQVEFYRPRTIDEAEIVFFDETNRADPKTLNTIFELVQFRSINGEKLPKLRSVVAAINPNDGNYQVDELDPAFVDRFDVFLQSEPEIDVAYFKKKFNSKVAQAVASFWNDYERNRKNSSRSSRNTMGYISPRRMEKITTMFMKIPSRSTILETLPPDVTISANDLFTSLSKAIQPDPKTTARKRTTAIKVNSTSKTISQKNIERITNVGSQIRHARYRDRLIKAIGQSSAFSDVEKAELVSFASTHLSVSVSPKMMLKNWAPVLEMMTPNDVKIMTRSWTIQKCYQLKNEVGSSNLQNKDTILKNVVAYR